MKHPQTSHKRIHHLRVPVLPKEKETIEASASKAGLSVAKYLREVGQGYTILGTIDQTAVAELTQINADLGRLGGLLKLWLTSKDKLRVLNDTGRIRALLKKIESTQAEMHSEIFKIKNGKLFLENKIGNEG
jgi:hypothetical protein